MLRTGGMPRPSERGKMADDMREVREFLARIEPYRAEIRAVIEQRRAE